MAFIFASSCFLLESHAFQWRAAARLSPGASQGALCCHSQGALTLQDGGRRSAGGVHGGKGGRGCTCSELNEPPGALGSCPPPSHLFNFPAFLPLPLFAHFGPVTDKAGPENNWARSQNWRVTAGLSGAAAEVT